MGVALFFIEPTNNQFGVEKFQCSDNTVIMTIHMHMIKEIHQLYTRIIVLL